MINGAFEVKAAAHRPCGAECFVDGRDFNGGDFNGGAVESHEQSLGRAAGEFGRELGAGLDRESI